MNGDVTARRRGWAFFTTLNAPRREWHPVQDPAAARADLAQPTAATDGSLSPTQPAPVPPTR